MEAILAEWVEFARSSGPAGKTMDSAALRDHAAEMLKTIVDDLQTRQTAAEQDEKSKGHAAPLDADLFTAAEVHGAIRAESGFTLGEVVSEYRALRASILRLWTKANGSLTGDDIGDLMRFNEAVDQATAESITRFMHDLDHSKEMFVAILGHDLRTPLNAVIMSSQFMLERGELREQDVGLATSTLRSARRMNRMVGDLLDLTRSRLGSGIPIVRADMDMEVVARQALEETAAANPERVLRFSSTGSVTGSWDAARITQVLVNLLSNAVQYGGGNEPITMAVRGEPESVVLTVHNSGPAISASQIARLFDPVKRLKDGEATSSTGNLGLGLYIAERIVTAHGGTIGVHSSGTDGTVFTVRLPR